MTTRHTDFTLLPVLAGATLLVSGAPAQARDYFDPGLLSLGGTDAATVDLSPFETSGKTPPGTYTVSLFINQADQGQHTLVFKTDTQGNIQPELTPTFLHELGVNTQVLPAFIGLPTELPVKDLATLIPESKIKFDFAQLRLDISIPQIAMQPNSQGAVDPALWDHGVPALLFNYNLNGGRNWQNDQPGMGNSTQTNLFAGVQGGANLQAWRLRSNMTYTRNTSNQSNMASQTTQSTRFSNTFLQRDIQPWRSEILLGENSTENDVFDSIPFRGVKLNSSDDMLPNSLRGFAPIISGIAQTNARVTVSQNGNVVYQTYVAPGPFRISDLFQTGQAGDLLLTVNESDGTVRTQTLAFSSLPVMRRQGSLKYEVTAGRYNGGITVDSQRTNFVLGTAVYGLPHDITLYGGTLLAKDYASAVAGSGFSLGNFGALSADITASSTKLAGQNDRQQGYSYRLRYSKSMLSTGTAVDLTAYRYSTRHYYSFSDFNNLGFQLSDGQVPWALERQRSNFQVRLSQQLNSWGSLYLSASRNDFWGNDKILNTVSAGYNGSYRGVSYGLAYSIDRLKGDGTWPENRQFSLNMQVPFSLFSQAATLSNAYASYQMTHNNQGQVQQQTGISGSAWDSRLSYSATQGWSNGQDSNNSTLNAGYQGSKGSASMGYSYSRQNRSLNMSGNGGLVVHPQGVTLSQMLGNSVAIVNAPGSAGTSVMSGNIQTDYRGYAVVPYLSSYQSNSVSLNPATLPDNVDISQSSLNIYPTKGAVVMANFATQVGYQVLMTLLQANNNPVPFGALVTIENKVAQEPNTGIVGEAGQVYLSGLSEQGKLKVVWGKEANQQCLAAFNMTKATVPSANNPVHVLTVICEGK
ncbi:MULTISPECIES: fimbria/pilus outer membrane usher protein [unclassified Serratia (in: enterobacteria)]|uniref:fimbria/pilus outer membrane usher protein n=1 Tax=unclassified Serratia (in: enterobacteria) TaxID=2647522 RepID=UPI000507F9BB|nr:MULTISPECIES: fimbria/pilus outer membrane usher protein [unclassified Serratia (in: enterobacteria)]KFK96912.1 fimbrial assembly protein [Serratia sp. Ag2]KFK97455.1 fimbrial assembly protein [Serratia sp. Ag1]